MSKKPGLILGTVNKSISPATSNLFVMASAFSYSSGLQHSSTQMKELALFQLSVNPAKRRQRFYTALLLECKQEK